MSANFDVVVKEFEKRFAAAKFRAALQDAGTFGISNMKSDTPVRTGFLRDSESYQLNSDYELEVRADAPYAGYVNSGTSRMRPNPFFDRSVGVITQRIVENLKKL